MRAVQGPGVAHDLPSQIPSQLQPFGMFAVKEEEESSSAVIYFTR